MHLHLQAIALVCLNIVQPFACDEKTDTAGNAILAYLGIDPKTVSNHKLTTVSEPRIHKRDLQQGTSITFRGIDEEISLWLRPTDSTLASDETPVYYAYYAPGYPYDVHFEKVEGAMKGVRKLLEDPEHYASVVLGTDDSGKITVNGHLRSPKTGASLVISSLPKPIVEGFISKQSSIDDLVSDSANLTYHVVVELKDNDDLRKIARKGLREAEVRANATNNGSPDVLYPQILVQLDYLHSKEWANEPLSDFLEYILSFWNGVDLIYRQVENPKIRLNIAGIIITKDFQATPFFWGNEIVEDETYNLVQAVFSSTFFFYAIEKSTPIPAFDAAVVMTKMRGIKVPQQGDQVSNGVAVDYGTICERVDADQLLGAIAIIYDNGAHAGISTAAHEIAHLLGAHHDNEGNRCFQMGPGGLMASSPSPTPNITILTDCALNDIRAEFNNGRLDCLYDVPQMKGTKLPGLMPGTRTDIAEQCKTLGYGLPCFPNGDWIDICYGMWCTPFNDTSSCAQTSTIAPPGMACLKENLTEYGICLKSRCVSV